MVRRSFLLFFCFLLTATSGAQAATRILSPGLVEILASIKSPNDALGAKQEVDKYIALYPKDGNAYAVRCIVDSLENSTPKGIASGLVDCKKGVEISPTSEFAHYEFANMLRIIQNYPKALAQYSRAIELGLTGGHIYEDRCKVFRHLGRPAEAISDCKKQMLLSPSSYSARVALGKAELASADYSKAVAEFADAVALQPFNIQSFELQAQADATLGRYASAEKSLTQAISLHDRNLMTYFMRAMMRAELGQNKRALSDLQKAKTQATAIGATSFAKSIDSQIKMVGTPHPFGRSKVAVSGPVSILGEQFSAVEVNWLMHGLYAGFDRFDQTVEINVHHAKSKEHLRWHLYQANLTDTGIARVTLMLPVGRKKWRNNLAYNGAVLAGLAASGYGGAKWKALYDDMRARDKSLPTTAPDPYLNRRAMADALGRIYEKFAAAKPHSPSATAPRV